MTTTGRMAGSWMAMDVSDILKTFGHSPTLENECTAWYLAPRFQDQVSVAVNVFFIVSVVVTLAYNVVFVNGAESKPGVTRSNSVRVIASCTAALAYLGAAVWEASPFVFLLAQCVTWVTFAAAEVRELPSSSRAFVRLWWTSTLVLAGIRITLRLIQFESCPTSPTPAALQPKQ